MRQTLITKFFFVKIRARRHARAGLRILRAHTCTNLCEKGNPCVSHEQKSKVWKRSVLSLRKYSTFSNHVDFIT